ncbi:MAG: DUF4435 domain-containing protein [Prevotella sp.]|nr:DUF4435 domain-containing protein [Prevotella sp.]
MSSRLKDNITSQYIEAANSLNSKQARRRIVAYVESYDDIYFWRTVLSEFENDKRYFEVMLPSKINLTRGKKSVLMNFLEGEPLGRDMIACVDADYDYLVQGRTSQSKRVLSSPYVFHTYVYAIENFQCYAPSLHNVCVSVSLNDHRIFDFRAFIAEFSEAIFPLFVWSIMCHRNGNHAKFSISNFNRVIVLGGFCVKDPAKSLANVRHKVGVKIRELQRQFPNRKSEYLQTKEDIKRLGVTPQTTYLYIQGHYLFDTIIVPIISKVCSLLRQERQQEINLSQAHRAQKRNEMACYENSLQDVKGMLKKNNGYMSSEQFRMVQADVRRYLDGEGELPK